MIIIIDLIIERQEISKLLYSLLTVSAVFIGDD